MKAILIFVPRDISQLTAEGPSANKSHFLTFCPG
jgi:hypothetical protein